ncbi:MAG: DUF4011 domain-containing protein [Balneolales bacterium]|nr:DUF4011 domain-containing protein [Balneolales bacterium]
MKLSSNFLSSLSSRLKTGNRRSTYLNAFPESSRYRCDAAFPGMLNGDFGTQFFRKLFWKKPFTVELNLSSKNIPTHNSTGSYQEKDYETVLQHILNQAENIKSDTGINSVALGYPMLVRRSKVDNKLIMAPLFVWDVQLDASLNRKVWTFKGSGTEFVSLNEVLLNYLKAEAAVPTERLKKFFDSGHSISASFLDDFCSALHNIMPLGNRPAFVNQRDLEALPEKEELEALCAKPGQSILLAGGVFGLFGHQKQHIIRDYERLQQKDNVEINLNWDKDGGKVPVFSTISSVKTDPSQQQIVNMLASGSHVLIQGPPGTGKSQTLTAILMNALAAGKKTLVVCEKKTALDVLDKALRNKGFDPYSIILNDAAKDARRVKKQALSALESISKKNESGFQQDDMKAVEQNCIETRALLNSCIRSVNKPVFGKLNYQQLTTWYLSETRPEKNSIIPDTGFEQFPLSERFCKGLTPVLLARYEERLENAEERFRKFTSISEVRFLNKKGFEHYKNLMECEEALHSDFSSYRKLASELRSLEKLYRYEYAEIRFDELKRQLLRTAQTEKRLLVLLNDYRFEDQKKSDAKLGKSKRIFRSGTETESQAKKRSTNELQILLNRYQEILESCTDIRFTGFTGDLHGDITTFLNVQQKIERKLDSFDKDVRNEYQQINVLDVSVQTYHTPTLSRLKSVFVELVQKISKDKWVEVRTDETTAFETFMSGINALFAKYDTYRKHKADAFRVEYEWYLQLNELEKELPGILNKLKGYSDWANMFLICCLKKLLSIHFNPVFLEIDNAVKRVRQSSESFVTAQIDWIHFLQKAELTKAVQGFDETFRPVSVESLFSGENNKAFLRHFGQSFSSLFTAFFPVVFTTPETCSHVFEGVDKPFDLVLFDEASQLRLEDTLPAMLKAHQIVIAGDENQMPPSSFFTRNIWNKSDSFDLSSEEDDEFSNEQKDEKQHQSMEIFSLLGLSSNGKDGISAAEEHMLRAESLLDFARKCSFNRISLDFHYRSMHPWLIDFSNTAFYGNRLKPVPPQRIENPITFVDAAGVYTNQINPLEAQRVVDILEYEINEDENGTFPTIGVATFNIAQRDHIKKVIQKRRIKADKKVFDRKMSQLETAGFFVKNLENVQGDERDVIILSTAYGKDRSGRFLQYFGPINMKNGFRLLNVIVTRARRKVFVCTSVPAEVFMQYDVALRAEGENNRKAVFYAYLAYAKAVSNGDDIARNEVLGALRLNRGLSTSSAAERSLVHQNTVNDIDKDFPAYVAHQLKTAFPMLDWKIHPPKGMIPADIITHFDVPSQNSEQEVPSAVFRGIAISCLSEGEGISEETHWLEEIRKEELSGNYSYYWIRLSAAEWLRNTPNSLKELFREVAQICGKSLPVVPEKPDDKPTQTVAQRAV